MISASGGAEVAVDGNHCRRQVSAAERMNVLRADQGWLSVAL